MIRAHAEDGIRADAWGTISDGPWLWVRVWADRRVMGIVGGLAGIVAGIYRVYP